MVVNTIEDRALLEQNPFWQASDIARSGRFVTADFFTNGGGPLTALGVAGIVAEGPQQQRGRVVVAPLVGLSATMSHMESIGVRELRRDASRWLARVRAGEVFVITDRGRPVAQLGPLAPSQGYDALVADGRLAPGSGRSLDVILDELDAQVPVGAQPSLAAALGELRADER